MGKGSFKRPRRDTPRPGLQGGAAPGGTQVEGILHSLPAELLGAWAVCVAVCGGYLLLHRKFSTHYRDMVLDGPEYPGNSQHYLGDLKKDYIRCVAWGHPLNVLWQIIAYNMLYWVAIVSSFKVEQPLRKKYTAFCVAKFLLEAALVGLCFGLGYYRQDYKFTLFGISWEIYLKGFGMSSLGITMYFVYLIEENLWSVSVFVAQISMAFVAYNGELLAVPFMLKAKSTMWEKMLTRLVLHRLLWEACLCVMRFAARQYQNYDYNTGGAFMGYIHSYYSIFGRFMLLQLQGPGQVFFINLALSLLTLCFRVLCTEFDEFIMVLQHGTRATRAIVSTENEAKLRAHETYSSMVAEYSGIIIAGVFGRMYLIQSSPGQVPAVSQVAVDTSVQLVMAFLVDYAVLKIDGFCHGMNHKRIWSERGRNYILLVILGCMAYMPAAVLDLVPSFCPSKMGGQVSLARCNEPSLWTLVSGEPL